MLRSQMLVHSFIYYERGDNLITDSEWQERANRLARLQAKYGHVIGFHDAQFAGWDGTTGYHLKYDAWVRRKAHQLLEINNRGRRS